MVEGVEVTSIVVVVVNGIRLDDILLDAEVELVVEDEVLVKPNMDLKQWVQVKD
jgi:hypothetical protein